MSASAPRQLQDAGSSDGRGEKGSSSSTSSSPNAPAPADITARSDQRHTQFRWRPVVRLFLLIFVHALSVLTYLSPLVRSPTPSDPFASATPASSSSKNGYPIVAVLVPSGSIARGFGLPRDVVPKLIVDPPPQLDELHVASNENGDVTGAHRWTEAWSNDYWGRPLSYASSHKSWRPLSTWSFRFFKGGAWLRERIASFFLGGEEEAKRHGHGGMASELFVHRVVNVLIHSATAELVGVMAALLFPEGGIGCEGESDRNFATRLLAKILFALHPTHVEAVANIANRPHMLALLFMVAIVDPTAPLLMVLICAVCGLLSSETAIFQFPAALIVMTAIRYFRTVQGSSFSSSLSKENGNNDGDDNDRRCPSSSPLRETVVSLIPRYALLATLAVAYLVYRHWQDALSIPDGLIRPAENPFYAFRGSKRFVNFAYVLSIHALKSLGVDVLGFSHEYGYDCIPELRGWFDARILLPLGVVAAATGAVVWASGGVVRGDDETKIEGTSRNNQVINDGHKCEGENHGGGRTERTLLLLVFASWMATLFPVSGILKVGTFVADRIVVASTVGTCVFGGRLLAVWIVGYDNGLGGGGSGGGSSSASSLTSTGGGGKTRRIIAHAATVAKAVAVARLLFAFRGRVQRRTSEWMDAPSLLESSLRTCPRSIKSNLEMSKVYSGLFPHMLDLTRARKLIETSQSIDPTYCDVHHQFAHVYFQQRKYVPFEEEMVESLMCPFTMGQAMTLWNKYWKAVMADPNMGPAAKERHARYMVRINEAVAKAHNEEDGETTGTSGGRSRGAGSEL